MHFKSIKEFQQEVDKLPPSNAYVIEDGIKWLNQSYAINRMNEVFGEGNWNIENIQKTELRNEEGNLSGNACTLTVTFKHPTAAATIQRVGTSGTEKEMDNNIIGRAFLNAISSIGITFGRGLSDQFE